MQRQMIVIQKVKSTLDRKFWEQHGKALGIEWRDHDYLLQMGDDEQCLYLEGQYREVAELQLNGKNSLTLATTNPRALVMVEYYQNNK